MRSPAAHPSLDELCHQVQLGGPPSPRLLEGVRHARQNGWKPVAVLAMRTATFRTWKRENGFDNARAARRLGVPMARVADWSSGRELAPPEVAAACYAYSCGWRPSLETAPAPRRKRRSAALEQIRVVLGLPEDASTESITQAAAKASEPSLKDRTEALAAWILGGRPVPGTAGTTSA